MQIWRRLWLLIPLLIGAYGLVVILALFRPPLQLALGYQKVPEGAVVAVDLVNRGNWSVRLHGLDTQGGCSPDAVLAVARTGSYTGGHVALYMESPDRTGPVRGWLVSPDKGPVPRPMYGIRLTWSSCDDLPHEIRIRYRYLGWPMSATRPFDAER